MKIISKKFIVKNWDELNDEEKICDYIENDKLNYIKKYLFIF